MNRVTAICRTSGIHVQTFAFKRKRRNLPFAFNVRSILATQLPACLYSRMRSGDREGGVCVRRGRTRVLY
jgi:hypothetical protein